MTSQGRRFEMKRNYKLAVLMLGLLLSSPSFVTSAQSQPDPQKSRQRTTTPATQDKDKNNQKPASTSPADDRLEPDDNTKAPSDVPEATQANRREQLSEEAAVVSFYNNFFTTY